MKMKNIFPRNVSFARTASIHINPKYVNQAQSGKDNFEQDFKNSHVNTTFLQKVLLGVGSGIISITSPSRGDMIAVMGEVTGYQALKYIQSQMHLSDEGRQILQEKPRISSGAINLEKLNTYPPGTLGKAYSNFLNKYGYTPDSRNAVKFVDDLELAYVAQRYREVHDLFHTLLDMPTNMLGEVTVKWVEAIQTKLPMCAAGALFGSVRLAPKFVRRYSTKVDVAVYPNLVEKFKSGELKPRHVAKEMQLGNIELPKTIAKGLRSTIDASDYSRQMIFKGSGPLRNKLWVRKIPLEEFEISNLKEVLQKNLYKVATENYQNNIDSEHEYGPLVDRMLHNYISENKWQKIKYNKLTGLQYLAGRGPAEYAAVKKVFNEIAIRDREFSPVTYFDFGSGVGTAVWAARNMWSASLKEYICIDKSLEMNNIAEEILKNIPEFEEVLKCIHYRRNYPRSITCDIVVSAFSLFELPNMTARLKKVTHLWNTTSNYLVLLEVGTNQGFRLISQARSYILETSKKYGIKCHVFAPCPHDSFCPRLNAPGKLTPCNFNVTYSDIFNAQERGAAVNETFCYVVLKKGDPPAEENRTNRIVRETNKRHHCVTCQLCTNSGNLETLYVGRKKYGKEVYQLFKHLKWGSWIPSQISLHISNTRKKNYISDDKGGQTFLEESNVDKGEYISDEDSDENSDDEPGKNDENTEGNYENVNDAKNDDSKKL